LFPIQRPTEFVDKITIYSDIYETRTYTVGRMQSYVQC